MKPTLMCVVGILLSFALGCVRPSPPANTPDEDRPLTGGLVTLRPIDPLAGTMSFNDGLHGSVIQDFQLKNRDSHLAFHLYKPDSLTCGVQGGQVGRIVDLGSQDELAGRYGFKETVGGGQGFASLHYDDTGRLVVRKSLQDGSFQPLTEAEQLQKPETPKDAKVAIGHVYLVRITDPKGMEITVKLLVVDHDPSRSVVLRWERLEGHRHAAAQRMFAATAGEEPATFIDRRCDTTRFCEGGGSPRMHRNTHRTRKIAYTVFLKFRSSNGNTWEEKREMSLSSGESADIACCHGAAWPKFDNDRITDVRFAD